MRTESQVSMSDQARARALRKSASQYGAKIEGMLSSYAYDVPESSLLIASDTKYQNMVARKVAHLRDVSHVILVGIGGSCLGTEAVYAALRHTTEKKLYTIDAIEEDGIAMAETLITNLPKKELVAVVLISKSGTTTETLVNGVQVLEIGTRRFGDAFMEQVVFIGTDGTEFMKVGKKKKATCIPFPEMIGGRYSVFSAVGIVPLLLLGIDTDAFRAGAVNAIKGEARSAAGALSAELAQLAETGIHTVNFFTLNARLIKLGEWYRQLLAESIGKPTTRRKKPFTRQLLPTVSSSVDLHSQAQLYLGGYQGLFTHFVFAAQDGEEKLPASHWLTQQMSMLQGKTPNAVKDAIQKGVIEAYREASLPFRISELEGITPYEIGAFMETQMFEVMCLAHLCDVNAFDQPQVELYKKHTRSLLES